MRGRVSVSCALVCAVAASSCGDAFAVKPISIPVQLTDLDGQSRALRQAGQDGPIVTIFSRSDCPISNRYAPEVRRLYEEYHPQGVAFYLIYVDPRETAETIRAHLQEYEYPCAALRDREHHFAEATGATVTPEAVVFNAENEQIYRGRIDDLFVDFGKSRSEATSHDLEDAIVAALAGRPVEVSETEAVGCFISDLK